MNWSEQFENYINKFTDINNLTIDDLKNNNIDNVKKLSKGVNILYNIKLQTDWINGKDINFGSNGHGDHHNEFILFNNDDIIIKIRNIFESHFGNGYEICFPKIEYNPEKKSGIYNPKKSFKINRIDYSKYKYFINCNFNDKQEYIKINLNKVNCNIRYILKNNKIKILCVPWIMKDTNYNFMIGLKIDSIIVDYNKDLLKYKPIKDIIDIVINNKKKETKELVENNRTNIKIETKFNKYKYKNKTKLDESNSKILDFINNSHTF